MNDTPRLRSPLIGFRNEKPFMHHMSDARISRVFIVSMLKHITRGLTVDLQGNSCSSSKYNGISRVLVDLLKPAGDLIKSSAWFAPRVAEPW